MQNTATHRHSRDYTPGAGFRVQCLPPLVVSGESMSSTPASANEGSIKETIESIVIAFILAFVFRAFVVEAFVIPTGSMAPTLLGQHLRMVCPECGHSFLCGPRDYGEAGGRPMPFPIQGENNPLSYRQRRGALEVSCPMCLFPVRQTNRATDGGDRILVLKYLYQFTEPRRWDAVVFKNPKNPLENYIKRLIGKPEEWLWLVRGNVYTRATKEDPWQIERKPADVQRAVWQPLYHSDFVPLDAGTGPMRDVDSLWHVPWVPQVKEDWTRLDGGRVYRFVGGEADGRLDFDFAQQHASSDYYPYNSFDPRSGRQSRENGRYVVDELRVAATVTPELDTAEMVIQLTTAQHELNATLTTDGRARLSMAAADDAELAAHDIEAPAGTVDWQAGRGRRIELWHVDQAVMLWVDGKMVGRLTYGDALDDEAIREVVDQPTGVVPKLSLSVTGGPMRLSQVDVDRDLYYTPQTERHAIATDEPIKLKADRFFCLGDNSPQSEDSRLWPDSDPWIKYHTSPAEDELQRGRVPRKLLIGKAFFVYWPSSYRLNPESKFIGVVPNVADMRFIK